MQHYQEAALFLLVLAIVTQLLHVMLCAQPEDDTMAPAPTVLIGDTVPSLTGYSEQDVLKAVSLDTEPHAATVVSASIPNARSVTPWAPSGPPTLLRAIRRQLVKASERPCCRDRYRPPVWNCLTTATFERRDQEGGSEALALPMTMRSGQLDLAVPRT